MRRYNCPEGHGTFSVLPVFLCRYVRFLTYVVRTAFENYDERKPLNEIPVAMGGPSFGTVCRWLAMLRSLEIPHWLEQKRQALRAAQPPEHLDIARHTWALALNITRDRPNCPAALIVWARLLHLTRYGSPTYRNI